MRGKKSTKNLTVKTKKRARQSNNNEKPLIKKQGLKSAKSSSGKVKGSKPSNKNGNSCIKKQYLKSNGSCNVTFILQKKAAPDAQVATIVGDFNDWNLTELPMKKLKNGNFKITLKLPRNREYRFRYLIDTNQWENDWHADKYVPNPFGCDDSLVIV
ncbi:MAG: isoamylase early set domain-containing protein [Candidatus Hodarchaeales archaeon]|jgi:hypothetical protein